MSGHTSGHAHGKPPFSFASTLLRAAPKHRATRTAPVPAQQRGSGDTPEGQPKAAQGVSTKKENQIRRAGFSHNPTRPKTTTGGAVHPIRQPPPAHAAIGRGFAARTSPKPRRRSKRHEPRPTQTQPGTERKASGFLSEGENGVKRLPSGGKPEAVSANRLKPEFTHNVPLCAGTGFQRRSHAHNSTLCYFRAFII